MGVTAESSKLCSPAATAREAHAPSGPCAHTKKLHAADPPCGACGHENLRPYLGLGRTTRAACLLHRWSPPAGRGPGRPLARYHAPPFRRPRRGRAALRAAPGHRGARLGARWSLRTPPLEEAVKPLKSRPAGAGLANLNRLHREFPFDLLSAPA